MPGWRSNLRATGGNHLAERDSAVVRRHALVPIRLEPFRLQPPRRPFRQITILKTAAAHHHPPLASPFGHGYPGLGQRVVNYRGNSANGNAILHVG